MFDSTFDAGYVDGVTVEVAVHLPWSCCVPDGVTVMLLDQADPAGAGAFEALERIGAWEKVISWAQARQFSEIVGFVACAEAAPAEGLSAADAVESAEAEVGLMLRLSAGGAAWRVGEARQLVERFPATFAVLATGAITLVKARIIADGCADLDSAHAAAVQAKVLPRAPEQTNGQLRAAVRRAVLCADPAAAGRRHQRKRRERGVVLYPERDGMATLAASLPAAEAVGAYAVLDQHARGCGNTDERTMDARRADALVDLVLRDTGFCSTGAQPACATAPDTEAPDTAGTTPPAGTIGTDQPSGVTDPEPAQPTDTPPPGSTGTARPAQPSDLTQPAGPAQPADPESARPGADRLPGVVPEGGIRTITNAVSVQIRVTVPLDTLRGVGEEPGDLAGYGPIPADQARELAADPDSVWYRLVTDPLSGALLDYGTTRYRPPAHLAEHVVARHQHCQYPGCRVPAHRCDLDHNQPFDPTAGQGDTSAANLGPKCRPHHRLKGRAGWSVTQYTDGSITWTTPSGHTYHVDPPPLTDVSARPDPTMQDPTKEDPPPF